LRNLKAQLRRVALTEGGVDKADQAPKEGLPRGKVKGQTLGKEGSWQEEKKNGKKLGKVRSTTPAFRWETGP